MSLSTDEAAWLLEARQFFVGHKQAIGVLVPEGKRRMLIKSGEEGGLSRQKIGVPGYSIHRRRTQPRQHCNACGRTRGRMWQREFKKAVLVVDRPLCTVCSRLLPTALPPGSWLMVISEQEGETTVWSTHV